MAIPLKVIKFLETAKVKYEPVTHKKVFTAYDKAQTLKVSQKSIGKTLVIKLDKGFAVALIPANKNLDKIKLKKTVNIWRKKTGQKAAKNINFATEAWMKKNLRSNGILCVPGTGSWQIHFAWLMKAINRGCIFSMRHTRLKKPGVNWTMFYTTNLSDIVRYPCR